MLFRRTGWWRWLTIPLIGLCLAVPPTAMARTRLTQRVLLVVVDGLRSPGSHPPVVHLLQIDGPGQRAADQRWMYSFR